MSARGGFAAPKGDPVLAAPAIAAADRAASEIALAWAEIKESPDQEDFEAFLRHYGDEHAFFAYLARKRLARRGSVAAPALLESAASRLPVAAKAEIEAAAGDVLLRLDAGMHTATISRISLGADGRLMATASADKTVRLWSLPDGKPLRTLRPPVGPGNEGKVFAVALAPDARWVAAGIWHRDGGDNRSLFLKPPRSGGGVLSGGEVQRHLPPPRPGAGGARQGVTAPVWSDLCGLMCAEPKEEFYVCLRMAGLIAFWLYFGTIRTHKVAMTGIGACLRGPAAGPLRLHDSQQRGAGMGRRTLTLAGMGLWGCLLGIGALAAPAAARQPADDYVPYHPSGFFVFNWSGFYVGGSLGAAHTLAQSSVTLPVDFPNISVVDTGLFSFGQSETSLAGGIHAGWQQHWGRLVAGVEAGFNVLSFNATTESPLVPQLRRTVELRDILVLTGRLGYADGRWLAYAKAGVVNAEIDVSYDDGLTGISSSSGGRETGWTAGVGIEYALTLNLFLGVEYNYLHFRADAEAPRLPDARLHIGDADTDVQNVVLRLNYRFGAPCCPEGAGP